MSDDGEIPEIDYIDSPEKLEVYLQDKPIQLCQNIALIAAIRLFPLAMHDLVLSGAKPNYARLLLLTWRAILISSICVRTGKAAVENSLANAFDALQYFDMEGDFGFKSGGEVSIRAAESVAAVFGTDDSRRFVEFTKYLQRVTDFDHEQFWSALRQDLYGIASKYKGIPLALLSKIATDFNVQIMPFDKNMSAMADNFLKDYSKTSWGLISEWYFDVIRTSNELGFWGLVGEDLDLEIVNLSDNFWARAPEVVMSDIAHIVGWPDYQDNQKSSDLDVLIDQQCNFIESIENRANAGGEG